MKRFVAFIVIVLLSSPAYAQTPRPRFDAAALKQATSSVAASKKPMSYGDRVLAGTVIGGTLGALSGIFFWKLAKECDDCWPSAAKVIAASGANGAAFGAMISALIFRGMPQRRPGIPLGRRVVVNPAVAPARVAGAVTVTF